jgi:hypothetical protein
MLKKNCKKILIGIVVMIVIVLIFHLIGNSVGMLEKHFGI